MMAETDKNEKAYNLNWQAAETNPELIEPLRNKLREVVDPEIGMNVIELGLIRDLIIENDQIEIKMILTTPFCPYAPVLIDMVKRKAEEALNHKVIIAMGHEIWDPSMMEDSTGVEWGLF